MAAHAKLSASKVKQVRACPGSLQAQAGYPNISGRAAEKGTAAHWVAEQALLRARSATVEFAGQTAPNGVKITKQLATPVQRYVDEVRARASGAEFVGIEQSLSQLATLHPDLGGTSDSVIYRAANKTLHVLDYKDGAGVVVDPEENEQGLTYALGALLLPELKGAKIETVEIVIVQPNAPGETVKPWFTDKMRLIEWGAELVEIAEAANSPNAPRVAGPQCQFCLAKGECQTFYEKALDAAGLTPVDFFSDVIPKVEVPARLSPEELTKRLKQSEHLKRWIKSVEDYAYQRAMEGDAPKGFKLVEGRANRAFVEPLAAIKAVAEHFELPVSEFFEEKPLSVAQVEAAIGKKEIKAWPLWDELIAKKRGAPVLAWDQDKRPTYVKDKLFDDVSGFDDECIASE